MSLTQIDQDMICKENTDEIDKKSHDTSSWNYYRIFQNYNTLEIQ